MIVTAAKADGAQIQDITARAGVFSEEEIQCVSGIWGEYEAMNPHEDGYRFIVEREEDRVLGYACYGTRDLAEGVYDLFWIAVDPAARRGGVGRKLLSACENIVREAGGRMLVAETSGAPLYESTRKFYADMGYKSEAIIKDFYKEGDDLVIFIKRL